MKFRIESRGTLVVSQSEVPHSVTNTVLERAKFKELPEMYSSVVEDFLIESINKGSNPEVIKAESKLLEQKIKDLLKITQEQSALVDWDSILNVENENKIKQDLVKTALELGASEEAVNDINNIKFQVSESMGASWSGEVALVARHQIIRKALDYVRVFPEADLNEVIKTLMLTTGAHEAGHIIDEKLGLYSKRMPNEKEWNDSENKSERFAEFWPYTIDIPGIDLDIRRQEKLIHVKKVQEVWVAIDKYNKQHPEIGIHQLFNFIQTENKQVKDFIFSRRTLYGGNQPENYTSPYSLEELLKVKGN